MAQPLTDAGVVHHPVAELIQACLEGDFPPPDGSWEVVPPWHPNLAAIISVTGRAMLCLPEGGPVHTRLKGLLASGTPVDGFGAAQHPQVVTALAGNGWVDDLDLVLARTGLAPDDVISPKPEDLREVDPPFGHPRVDRAVRIRDDVRVYRIDGIDGLVTVGSGIGALPEISVEADLRGGGRWLVDGALRTVAKSEVVIAAVAPGNTRSLRLFLTMGFVPVASAQLFIPE
ncbi:hypothetical protein [Janibacter sp. GXQ6167]|uniref:hypothetical protein n=1 Tax=Janibacter sp. GXQ6167 TaxID=3240791 RepID=UPI003524A61A